MLYIALVLGYCLALFLLMRLFPALRNWDNDVDAMMNEMRKEFKEKEFKSIFEIYKSDYKSFGTLNGWDRVPEEVERCSQLKHQTKKINSGHSLTIEYCPACKYYFEIDSSD
jgi:hypothetical protein